MANKGAPTLLFNSVTLDADDCFQASGLDLNVQPITYICNGRTKTLAGPGAATLSFTVALAGNDTAKITAFREGVNATDLIYRPGGATSGYVSWTSDDATVMSASFTGNPDGMLTMACALAINAITQTTVP